MDRVDWTKPIFAKFNKEPDIKCFIVGEKEDSENMYVGIPDPEKENKGLIVEVTPTGHTASSGKFLISN